MRRMVAGSSDMTANLFRIGSPDHNRGRMALFNLRDLRATLARNQRLIGLDPGSRTIGVALSDVGLSLASPYGASSAASCATTRPRSSAIARKEGAGGLVVGLPLSMDGSVGPAAQAARDWALALSEATGLPTALWDERLSSAAVNRFLVGEADLSRRKRGRGGGPDGGGLDAAGGAGRLALTRSSDATLLAGARPQGHPAA